MGHSIQDYLRKINSQLTFLDCVSVLATMAILVLFTLYLYITKQFSDKPVIYNKIEDKKQVNQLDSRPFASITGKTYTFSWCQGGENISPKNKIYFKTEEEAIHSGRLLSKLCQK